MSLLGNVLLLTAALLCTAVPAPDGSCPRPPRLDDAALLVYWDDDFYSDGAQVIYHCRPGYNLLGTIKMICKNGNWKYLLPEGRCMKKSCGHPGDIPFGSFQLIEEESFVFGAVVEYSCNEGYRMVSKEKKRLCTDSGWSNNPPHCEEIICKTPVIDNGEVIKPKIDYKSEEVIQFTCKEGFTPNTNREVTCTKDGWNPNPSCNDHSQKLEQTNAAQVQDHCQQPEPINGAQLQGEWNEETYPPGKVANFACLPEYTQDGPIKMACIEGTWWQIAKGQCKVSATSCKPPPPVVNARINGQTMASYASGEKVTYSCNSGYSMRRSLTGEAVCENTHWIDLPVCRKIGAQCGPPPVVQFGDTTKFPQTSYKSGDSVEYKCPAYYILKGNKIVSCLNGFWDEAPACLEPCTAKEKDMNENNIQLKWRFHQKLYSEHGDYINFFCKLGYEAPPDTQMRIVCEQGKLNYPKCFKRGFCVLEQQTMITNNIHYNISTVVDHGERITFECNEGMEPEDKLEAKCERRNINYPKCTATKSCKTPEIQNGFLRTKQQASYNSGLYVEFECNEGYVINGRIIAKCENSQWTDLPVCLSPCKISTEDLTKYNIQLLPSADPKNILDSDHRHGTELSVTCKSGFRRPNQAALVIECDDGKFRYPRCFSGKICRIDQDILDENNLELDEVHNNEVYYEEGEMIQFRCKNGFGHRGKPTGICSGQKLSYPICTGMLHDLWFPNQEQKQEP